MKLRSTFGSSFFTLGALSATCLDWWWMKFILVSLCRQVFEIYQKSPSICGDVQPFSKVVPVTSFGPWCCMSMHSYIRLPIFSRASCYDSLSREWTLIKVVMEYARYYLHVYCICGAFSVHTQGRGFWTLSIHVGCIVGFVSSLGYGKVTATMVFPFCTVLYGQNTTPIRVSRRFL